MYDFDKEDFYESVKYGLEFIGIGLFNIVKIIVIICIILTILFIINCIYCVFIRDTIYQRKTERAYSDIENLYENNSGITIRYDAKKLFCSLLKDFQKKI